MNTIYDSSDEIVGIFRFGVAWCRKTGERLGEYDESNIYNSNKELVATVEGDTVRDPSGRVLGICQDRELVVDGDLVGRYIGYKHAGAAAIALIFNAKSSAL